MRSRKNIFYSLSSANWYGHWLKTTERLLAEEARKNASRKIHAGEISLQISSELRYWTAKICTVCSGCRICHSKAPDFQMQMFSLHKTDTNPAQSDWFSLKGFFFLDIFHSYVPILEALLGFPFPSLATCPVVLRMMDFARVSESLISVFFSWFPRIPKKLNENRHYK